MEDISVNGSGVGNRSGNAYVVVPKGGTVTAVYSVIDASTSVASATLDIFSNNGGGTNSLGTITVLSGSAAGSTHNNTSLSNNTVASGNNILIRSDGGSTGVVSAVFTIEITY
jgi:hypothetical protein